MPNSLVFPFLFGSSATVVTLILTWLSLTSPGPSSSRAAITIRHGNATVWLGLTRSCAQKSNVARYSCTSFNFNPVYNFTQLGQIPIELFEAPSAACRASAWLVTILTAFLIPLFVWVVFRPQCKAFVKESWELNTLLCILLLESFIAGIGVVTFWFLDVYFHKIRQDLEVFAVLLGLDITASHGSMFAMAYAGFAVVLATWIVTAMDMIQTHEKQLKAEADKLKSEAEKKKAKEEEEEKQKQFLSNPFIVPFTNNLGQIRNAVQQVWDWPKNWNAWKFKSASPNEVPVPPPA